MFDIDFDASYPQLICHESYEHLRETILKSLSSYFLRDHFILFSSGTTGGDLKGYALSKRALFANADAVNTHFNLTSKDVWGLSLPPYHIGGLSVLARAHRLGYRVVHSSKWNPEKWIQEMSEVTITTIVPTQLFDLVNRNLKPWPGLKFIVVGGDFLSQPLKKKAIDLGWPVIRTFGMSEVCSQIASSKNPQSDELEVLPIHKVKTVDGRLLIKSEALFTLEFTAGKKFSVTMAKKLCDEDSFYVTKDKALVSGNVIHHLGRIGDDVKISGHLVNLPFLKNQIADYLLEKNLFNKVELIIENDERKGKKLVLKSDENLETDTIETISKLIHPVKIDETLNNVKLERTLLGKLRR